MVKFILLGHRRCGSTVVLCGLAESMHIFMFSELFHERSEVRQEAYRVGLRDSLAAKRRGLDKTKFYQIGEDGGQFIRDRVFFPRYWSPVAVGFKIFYHHAHDTPAAEKAWDYLFEHREIKVIHLVRRNLLESFLSLQIALQTDEWTRAMGEVTPRRELPPQHLTVAECAEYFADIERQREWARSCFRHHQLLEIEYERDICLNFQDTIHRIQAFLDIPCLDAQQFLEKQALHKPWQKISNYSELKEHFRNSAYAELFN